MMESADNIIDIGPGPGIEGGYVVAQGDPLKFLEQESLTSNYLSRKLDIIIPKKRRKGNGDFLHLTLY